MASAGFGVARANTAIVAGAALTATSVGITARVLADLGRLQDAESRIILGAAVLDDIIGLIILTTVSGLTEGKNITPLGLAVTTVIAIGFLVVTLLLGRLAVGPVFRLAERITKSGSVAIPAVALAFALAWLAAEIGSAAIIGAFAAGLLLTRLPQATEIQRGVTSLGRFFVPIFFIMVGAAVRRARLEPVRPGELGKLAPRLLAHPCRRRGQGPGRLCPLLVPGQEECDWRGHGATR